MITTINEFNEMFGKFFRKDKPSYDTSVKPKLSDDRYDSIFTPIPNMSDDEIDKFNDNLEDKQFTNTEPFLHSYIDNPDEELTSGLGAEKLAKIAARHSTDTLKHIIDKSVFVDNVAAAKTELDKRTK